MKDYIVIIPARGKSKRIPRKNLTMLKGKPLMQYTIEAAQKAKLENIVVSTDDPDIQELAHKLCCDVVQRPASLAGDNVSTEDVVSHVLMKRQAENVVLIQPTSPLLMATDIVNGIDVFKKNKYDSMFSACIPNDMLLWRQKSMVPVNYNPGNRLNKEERPTMLIETGAFYIFTAKGFKMYHNRLHGNIGYALMPYWRSFEVDLMEDIVMVERLL